MMDAAEIAKRIAAIKAQRDKFFQDAQAQMGFFDGQISVWQELLLPLPEEKPKDGAA